MAKATKQSILKTGFSYPVSLLRPINDFLRFQLKRLERNKKHLTEEDPFSNIDRLSDNAAPDADAEEQFGHARATALRRQIERNIIQTRRALARVKIGKYGICEKCGNMIDTDRLIIFPETTVCVKCKKKKEIKRRK
ncbi:hypothetical protein A2382_03910 [Candidatus Woesebacteria bacterium RIFOXYB1_FULL_38_16]|uniref:Zinc finger DksA/TraR C4-type domain-containing protein n=1 Tax=Candidatus Woesebacteria bacterium RIFOXYB1_FULL_38_16 TaxID=1802538 RepID=A0A1F8CV96_9BACT|nr:MAG: hypothetical protein A2191_03530 [Candidatus Woesebacteria bacterium RIFOXYA1_FULL_38_9]OGM80257.1 MAG: hypothetical protein A2382_03910 [Candidatus Woesebacteria bacterium RIFOXYB1_FULL_38_16]